MAKSIKVVFASAIRVLRQLNWTAWILLVAMAAAVMMGGALMVTGQPGFCNSCHIMNPYYDSWKKSSHAGVNCLDCHLQPGFTGYVKGKINGLAQAVDCIVGRVGTKPRATVEDASCLRPECHNTAELTADSIDYKGVKFTHSKHLAKIVDGIHIACGTCHSHFEGSEHFKVNSDVCFTCHFLRGGADVGRLVETNCQSCHEVPKNVIRRGFATIDHAEFVSYKASCEGSCHKKDIERTSDVDENVCLSCHDVRGGSELASEELHASHTSHEKVECFACHGKTLHGQKDVSSVAAMMDCRSCHSDTHQVQQRIYATDRAGEQHARDRTLSPMFLTHVECTGCHIERTSRAAGTLDSLGTVARAVPAACDNCHEEGTGRQYIPYWQSKIKELYARVNEKLDEHEAQARRSGTAGRSQDVKRALARVRSILDSVSADGSWGVHNFKYTEAMLLEADRILSEL